MVGGRSVDQLAARERQAGPTGMAEGLVVLMASTSAAIALASESKPGNGSLLPDTRDQVKCVRDLLPYAANSNQLTFLVSGFPLFAPN